MSTRRSLSHNGSMNRNKTVNPEGGRAQWSNQSFTVDQVVKQFPLPQIVKCTQQCLLTKKNTTLPVNLTQPILLYRKRTIRKLLARNVFMDPETQRYTEKDETIVIPADYEGRFLRLSSRTAKDSSCHTDLETLSHNQVQAFLTLTKLTANVIGSGSESQDYDQVNYGPGNVFLIDRVYLGTTHLQSEGRLFGIRGGNKTQVRYLKCRDEKDMDVLLPLSQTGEFVEVIPNKNGDGRLSVDSKCLIAKSKYPALVRFLTGRRRPRLKTFTGLFTLLDSFEETTLFGCVLDPSGFTMIEIPISSPLKFQLALNKNDLSLNPVVKNANKLCEENAVDFCKDLKLKFNFAQKITQISGRSVGPLDENNPHEDTQSTTNSARFGMTTTHIYL
ncbi:uncharacterized protein LOC110457548 [Mizuhopecten yessoensis]|uniref:CABIT domain-containing protein n=1 Tax=Mizuhopecten yessoensis TaxID=6573 RepID=A0A210Q8I1_MIZYE|nr:uncharacterized protein LOC110457548 [Mizuhopecten yessoensis]OWF45043.1 hypothetical protein KP79_PYT08076 [Mizuhopecten yessoensis]